jgi:hypothetical protein
MNITNPKEIIKESKRRTKFSENICLKILIVDIITVK